MKIQQHMMKAAFIILLMLAHQVFSQTPAQTTEKVSGEETILIDTHLVTLTGVNLDSVNAGRVATTKDFDVLVDGEKQELSFLSVNNEITVNFLIDCSASMSYEKGKHAFQLVKNYLKLAPTKTKFNVVLFNEKILQHLEINALERNRITELQRNTKFTGRTALYDTVAEIIKKLPNNSLSIIITDGHDTSSSSKTADELGYTLDAAGMFSMVCLLSPHLGAGKFSHFTYNQLKAEFEQDAQMLLKVTRSPVFLFEKPEQIDAFLESNRKWLGSTVQLGFYPVGRAAANGIHEIEVRLRGAKVQTRSTYSIK